MKSSLRVLVVALILAGAVTLATSAAEASSGTTTTPVTVTTITAPVAKHLPDCWTRFTLRKFSRDVGHAYAVHSRPRWHHHHLAFFPPHLYTRLYVEAHCQQPPSTRRAALHAWHHAYLIALARYQEKIRVVPSPEAACIIGKESGGNPQASNGTHFGIGQWSYTSWAGGAGTLFGAHWLQAHPSPLDATYNEQVEVLNSMLPAQQSQWIPYEPPPAC